MEAARLTAFDRQRWQGPTEKLPTSLDTWHDVFPWHLRCLHRGRDSGWITGYPMADRCLRAVPVQLGELDQKACHLFLQS